MIGISWLEQAEPQLHTCEVSPPGQLKAIEWLSHRAGLREGMLRGDIFGQNEFEVPARYLDGNAMYAAGSKGLRFRRKH